MIRLIDYLLLSNAAENKFAEPKYDFLRNEKHSVTMEFVVGEKPYFIKRSFINNDEILFGEKLYKLEKYSKGDVKSILTNKFFPFTGENIVFKGERYGTLMDFFVKDDLENQTRVEPTNFSNGTSKQASKAVFNFFLLGLPTKNLIKFESNNIDYDSKNKTIKGLEDKIKSDYGKTVEEFKSERIKIEESIALLEKSTKDYKFLEKYKDIESKLIDATSKINEKLKDYHSLNRKLTKVKESFQFNQDIDTKQIKNIYNEVRETFGDLVSKTLDDIVNFRKDILENRNKFLYAKESQLQKSVNTILSGISELEKTRSDLYKRLEEKGALESITNTYEQMAVEKSS